MLATMETTDPRMAMYSPDQIAKIKASDGVRRAKMKPRGGLGLPALLDQRRLEWGITDGAFDVQAAFDRILVFQIPEKGMEGGTYGDSGIIIPESSESARKRAAPRGIIVSAGLKALDELRSNGMELGDIVMFNHVAPWRVETDIIQGKWEYLLVMHTGHIIGSEDTTKRLRNGDLKVTTPGMAKIDHMYEWPEFTTPPRTPDMSGEY